MDDDQEPTPWEETTGMAVRPAAWVAPSTQRSVSLREADPTDLRPVSRAEFASAVAPCLQLVAPVGMDLESQDTWMEAAFKALDGIPIGLLKRGCEAAMRQADHPSKIVPAIIAEVKETWDGRKRLSQSYFPYNPQPALPEPEYCTPEQAAAIMKEYGLSSKFESNRDG
jgi:hypothetical protein